MNVSENSLAIIIAVVRNNKSYPNPGPEFADLSGDTVTKRQTEKKRASPDVLQKLRQPPVGLTQCLA